MKKTLMVWMLFHYGLVLTLKGMAELGRPFQ